MPSYLKQVPPVPAGATQTVRDTVSEILSDVERHGTTAVRRWSERFDGWSPESFRVAPDELDRAEASVSAELHEALTFAVEQVRGFAELQRATLLDLEVETLPGVTLGHRHVPVGAVGSYSPGGRYPLIAFAIMTVTVPKVAGVERVAACAPPREGRGIHPPQLYAMRLAGADEVLCCGGVQALAALAFGIDELEPVDMVVVRATPTSPKRSGSCSARSGSTCWPVRRRCWSSPTRAPTRASSRPTSSARPSTARRARQSSSATPRPSGARSWRPSTAGSIVGPRHRSPRKPGQRPARSSCARTLRRWSPSRTATRPSTSRSTRVTRAGTRSG